jgi:hypothetical protein
MTKLQKQNIINEIMKNEFSYMPNGDQLNEENLELLKPKQLEAILNNAKEVEINQIEKVYIENDFGFVVTTGNGTFKYKYKMDTEDKKDVQYFKNCVKESYRDSYNRNSQFVHSEVA